MTSSDNDIGRQSSNCPYISKSQCIRTILFRETFFNDLHLNTWARRYQNNLRTDIKYKPKVQVPRFYLLMPWAIDLRVSIDYYCLYKRVTKVVY